MECLPGRRVPKEAKAVSVPKELLPLSRFYLSYHRQLSGSFLLTYLVPRGAEFQFRKVTGAHLLQPPATPDRHVPSSSSAYSMVGPYLTGQTAGTAVILGNSILPWVKGHTLFPHRLVLFCLLEWQHSFLPHIGSCRSQEGVWVLYQVKWGINKVLLNRGWQCDLTYDFKRTLGGAWVAQLVELPLDFSSGHDLRVMGLSPPTSGSVFSAESAGPSPSSPLPSSHLVCTCTCSLINK